MKLRSGEYLVDHLQFPPEQWRGEGFQDLPSDAAAADRKAQDDRVEMIESLHNGHDLVVALRSRLDESCALFPEGVPNPREPPVGPCGAEHDILPFQGRHA